MLGVDILRDQPFRIINCWRYAGQRANRPTGQRCSRFQYASNPPYPDQPAVRCDHREAGHPRGYTLGSELP